MTDKILVDRSMVEQALDMFERGRFANKDVDGLEALCDVLRAALEQPQVELESIEKYQMQMAAISTAALGYWKDGDSIHPDYDTLALRDVAKLYANYDELYKAQPQVEQEPVAEITGMDEYGPMFGWHEHWVEFPVGTKLYIHQQPPRKPLTDEQIDALYIDGRQHWLGKRQIARAIEAAHGIGEKR